MKENKAHWEKIYRTKNPAQVSWTQPVPHASLDIAGKAVSRYMVVGTFSENGPDKCSGLPVKQYSELQLQNQLNRGFTKIKCLNEDHITPFGTMQNFLFCSFSVKPKVLM